MARSRRNRPRRRARRTAFRDVKPVILIVCEGENTEPQYFKGFTNAFRNPRVRIEIAPEHGRDPKSLVEIARDRKMERDAEAKRERDDNLAYDQVWCVFDFDDHPHIPDAKEMARDNGIELAVSNPCFELWLVLHFRDNPGMQPRKKIQKLLKNHVPEYDKNVNYATYSEGYSQAVTRATTMDEVAKSDGESGRNPTTGVYRLTESIRSDEAPDSKA